MSGLASGAAVVGAGVVDTLGAGCVLGAGWALEAGCAGEFDEVGSCANLMPNAAVKTMMTRTPMTTGVMEPPVDDRGRPGE